MKKMILVIAIVFFSSIGCGRFAQPAEDVEGEWHCRSLPEDFLVADLIGTWRVIHEAAVSSDRIILHDDGTYKQMIVKSNGIRYDSSWNSWWIEYRESGGTYLHLEGMRYCSGIDEDCERSEGGGGETLYYDYCENRTLRMKGEVLLAVVGAEGTNNPLLKSAPRGIFLMHMSSDRDSGTNYSVLEEN